MFFYFIRNINDAYNSFYRTLNESVNPYNTRGGKLLFIPHINATHLGSELLKCDGPLTWNNFFRSLKNKNLFDVGISKFERFLRDFLLENYS